MRKMQSCPPEAFAMYEHRAIYSVFVHLNFVNICLHGKHTYIFYILNLSIYRYIYISVFEGYHGSLSTSMVSLGWNEFSSFLPSCDISFCSRCSCETVSARNIVVTECIFRSKNTFAAWSTSVVHETLSLQWVHVSFTKHCRCKVYTCRSRNIVVHVCAPIVPETTLHVHLSFMSILQSTFFSIDCILFAIACTWALQCATAHIIFAKIYLMKPWFHQYCMNAFTMNIFIHYIDVNTFHFHDTLGTHESWIVNSSRM